MDLDGAESKSLFAQVQFYIVQTVDLRGDSARELAKLLEDNGAEEITRKAIADPIPLQDITHIISTTTDFPEYGAANDALKSVVKPDWVKASIAKGRLANPRQYSPDPRLFFSGLVVCCVDLPSGDSDAIIGGVLAMGGLYSSSLSKMVTHIVALTMDSDKCKTAISRNVKCKFVLPHWFDDCLKLGKRIDEAPYCLPDPEILRKRPEDRIPEAGRQDMLGASSPKPDRLPTPSSSPSANRRQLTVFRGKKVMLSRDLELGSHLLGTIEDLILNGGGMVTGSVYKADIFICHYRESLDYRIASRAGKDVGNLAWLYYLITHNAWTSPLRRLLHYPVARQGLPGFSIFRISLSNYNGEARVYLENLAKAAGGEFTKTMKEDNTHLITAHMVSEKCDAAKEWNIHMVNHLWLEESYAKWQIQTVSDPRYNHFPTRTNLGEVVGQTPIDKQAVEKMFFPLGSDVDPSAESDDVPRPMSVKPPNATSSRSTNAMNPHPSRSAGSQEVPFRALQSDGHTPKASKENRRHTEGNAVRTPASSRFIGQGKENETPSTTGSRSAKDKAVAKLHDLAPDIALFQKERKRVGGVTHGGRKSSEDLVPEVNRKRSVSKDEDTDTGADEETRATKRAKKSKGLAPPSMRLALSGYKGWVSAAKKEGEERARLRAMGILIVPDVASCTHLASPHILRTQKFICALAHAPIILSTDFVNDCLSQNKRLEPENYLLQDTESEKRMGYKLSDSLVRAKSNKGQLLRGYSIYCTELIHGGFETYKSIAEVNGGKCLMYRARAGFTATLRAGLDEEGDDSEASSPGYVYLISGTTPEEAKLWPKFRQMIDGLGKNPLVVRHDWIVDLALSQKHQWRDSYNLTEKDITLTA
ncbi:hypothetical protein HO133_002748 [Letharia lupina]|uniref:BRCT domain-containing protein n=1 Tax=Letharia lupina TaxID=560253 RepID=A0A8H6CCR1_9LECA|nr:uncharacterized protein HO133_002748 [Letharia lupina]KAF6221067.1 hypothetical protein HO133_002748 [Letharia lupina]